MSLCPNRLLVPWFMAALALASGPAVAGPSDAAEWLRKAHLAAQTATFSGSVVYQSVQGIRMAKLHQAPGHGGPMVRMETSAKRDGLDDVAEVVRHGREIRAYLPHRKEVRVGQEGMLRPDFPQLFLGDISDVLLHYRVTASDGPTFIGRRTKVLQLSPHRPDRWAVRCWIDTQSGLMLKQQILGHNGEVIDEQAFAELLVGKQAKPRVTPHHHGSPGWTEVPMEMRRVFPGPTTAPPTVRFPLAGFTLSHVFVSRDAPLTQWVFSDGIASVSVFVEPRSKNRVEREMGQDGTTAMASLRHGDHQISVLGDIPLGTAETIARGLSVAELRWPD